MSRLTERELTRLSFLMSSLVASPALSAQLIERVRTQSSGPFEQLVVDLNERIRARGTPATAGTLRDLVVELIETGDPDRQAAGRLLAAAIETASASEVPPPVL